MNRTKPIFAVGTAAAPVAAVEQGSVLHIIHAGPLSTSPAVSVTSARHSNSAASTSPATSSRQVAGSVLSGK